MMDERYLDTTKSVIISSPAGSGKTEKLAMRYISLLKAGAEVERILCITFTEKAAAEMKERILKRLHENEPELLEKTRPKIPLMRISTIHAFCLRLLKRFSMELGLEPGLAIMEEHQSRNLWSESVYDALMNDKGEFFDMIKARGIKGWNTLRSALDSVHSKEPATELLMSEGGLIDNADEGQAALLLTLYKLCLDRYKLKKQRLGLLDFSDIELLAYRALGTVAEAQNILLSFDMHTDHILVDEFQDTNMIQWKIIEKLTEEWRAGMGMKREAGGTPTVFLVGDDKQSIYLFRGASSGIFKRAADELSAWLGNELLTLMETKNYRSQPEIIRFVNELFARVMSGDQSEAWRSRYSAFEPSKNGRGRVHCMLVNSDGRADERRDAESRALASHISTLARSAPDWRPEGLAYKDMAILLRNRTHLARIEESLRAWDVPFVVVSGIGFNDEPEVALLHELVCLLVDPTDKYAAFCVLRSALVGMGHEQIGSICLGDESPMVALSTINPAAHAMIAGWLDALRSGSRLSTLLERAMDESGAWRSVSEPQRLANIRKFIQIVESMESGLKYPSPIEVREMLMRFRNESKVPKANVNTEKMNAVRIMTVHAAKGLQFPAVFLPFMDEKIKPRMESLVIDDEMGLIRMGFEEDSAKRSKIDLFKTWQEKCLEEEKRLFYVAATRAMDYLCMSGTLSTKAADISRLAFIDEAFGLADTPDGDEAPLSIRNIDPSSIESPSRPDRDRPRGDAHADMPVLDMPLTYEPERRWLDATSAVAHHEDDRGHGAHWSAIGEVIHRAIEMISRGQLSADAAHTAAPSMLPPHLKEHARTVEQEMRKITGSPQLMQIISPQDGARCELPFVLDTGDAIYKGRMDRVILKGGRVMVYDYKTYPMREEDVEHEASKYAPQLRIYKEAASRLFGLEAESHIVFTSLGRIVAI